MLKLEIQEQDGKTYLKISCECDDAKLASSATQNNNPKPSEKQTLSMRIKEKSSSSDAQEYEFIPEFTPKIYSFKGYLIVGSLDGGYWIYKDGYLENTTVITNLAEAFKSIEEALKQTESASDISPFTP